MTTFLDLTNAVLRRLRDDEVSTIDANAHSKMIGEFVNDVKRQVEDSFCWKELSVTLPIVTVNGTNEYVVTGSGARPKDVTVNDTSNKVPLNNVPIKFIDDQNQLADATNGGPVYYAWSGSDGTDSKVKLYPTPDGAYNVVFNMNVAQTKLVLDTDVLTLHGAADAIVMGAYARAIVERGEDASLPSSEAYGLYKGILSDMIALESNMFVENSCWAAT